MASAIAPSFSRVSDLRRTETVLLAIEYSLEHCTRPLSWYGTSSACLLNGEKVLRLWFTGRLANCKRRWQRPLYCLISHFDTVHTRCWWSMMAPADERCDRHIIALSHSLNTAISPVGYPSTEPQLLRCHRRRSAKRDTLDTTCDTQSFAYNHRTLPQQCGENTGKSG